MTNPAVLKRVREQPLIETTGDEGERRVKVWFVTGTKDTYGEVTTPEAFKAKMDWFVKPPSEGGHGGPMLVNHSNKAIGHWDKWGEGTHPKTGQLAYWIEGPVHRGPNGGEFPTADKAWNKAKAGAKGGSWGAYIKKEVVETDLSNMDETVTNADAYPYEVSLVLDFDGTTANLADPNSTMISINDKVKTTEEVNDMPDEVKIEETPVVPEPEKVKEEIKEPVKEVVEVPAYVTVADFEKFKTELLSKIPVPEKKEDVSIEDKIKMAVEDKMKTFIEKVTTPLPPVEKEKTEDKPDPDKFKIKDHAAFNHLPLEKRLKILAQEA